MRRAALLSMTVVALIPILAGLGHGDDSIEVVTDVRFAVVDGTPLSLDIYRPIEEGPYPAVVAVHGGGWRGGDKSDWRRSALEIARADFVVFSIEYRLAPPSGDAQFRDSLHDVRRAIGWIRDNGSDYGADPTRISLLGSSAGAQLVLLAGQKEAGIDAVATWSPPVDLVSLARHGFARILSNYLGCSLRRCPRRYRIMSPVRHVGGADPRTLVAGSRNEIIPVEQLDRMATRLDRASVPNVYLLFPGRAHGQELRTLVLPDTIEFLSGATNSG